MKYLKSYQLFEAKKEEKYIGKNRIILLGPPTIGKSTISQELGKQLKLEVIQLDRLQPKFGYSEENEVECVKSVLSEDYEKFNEPSILDFGGGHIYAGNAKEYLKGYKNVFVLVPTEDLKISSQILKITHDERNENWGAKPLRIILDGLKSEDCEFDDKRKKKLIDLVSGMIDGFGGKLKPSDIPKKSKKELKEAGFEGEAKGGIEWKSGWKKFKSYLTKKHDNINRSITDNIIEVFTEKGNRRSKSAIINEIIKKLV